MAFEEFAGKQTFSGADIMIIISVPFTSSAFPNAGTNYKVSAEIQTLTVSSTTSVLPVRRCGEARPKAYTRGARTFAGSMVFTITDNDPFKEIFKIDSQNNSMITDESWHIDQMPPFDIIILANNELGGVAAQIIHNIRIVNWGTTYSVDDMYTEYTYSYIAEHVTPLLVSQEAIQQNEPKFENLNKNITPDELFERIGNTPILANPKSVKVKSLNDVNFHNLANFGNFAANLDVSNGRVYVQPNDVQYSDPAIPNDIATDNWNWARARNGSQ